MDQESVFRYSSSDGLERLCSKRNRPFFGRNLHASRCMTWLRKTAASAVESKKPSRKCLLLATALVCTCTHFSKLTWKWSLAPHKTKVPYIPAPPQLCFRIPSTRDHKALSRGTLRGLGRALYELPCYFGGG